MAKIVLDKDSTNFNPSVFNENFRKIEEQLNDRVLYRINPPREPNSLGTALDMNGNRVFNLPAPISPSEPLRLRDVDTVFTASRQASESAAIAVQSAVSAQASAEEASNILEDVSNKADEALNVASDALNVASSVDAKATQALEDAEAALAIAGTQADWNASSGPSQILNKPSLGTASEANSSDFATAIQGYKADTAIQPSELSVVATSGLYSDLMGRPTLGSAAASAVTDFATAAQGETANTALTTATGADSKATQAISDASTALSLAQSALVRTNNLSDVTNIVTARSNLGLGTASTYTVGTGPTQIPTNNQIATVSTATTTAQGVVTLSTAAEAIAGTSTTKVLTSSNLSAIHPRINRTSPSQVLTFQSNIDLNIGGVTNITFPSTGVWIVTWGTETNGLEVGRIITSFWQGSTELARGGTEFGNNQGATEAWGSSGTAIAAVSSTSTVHNVKAYLIQIGTPPNTTLLNLYFRAVRIGPVT